MESQKTDQWFEFFVPGVPATAGSKRAIPVRRVNGQTVTIITDDNKRSKPWMQEVAHTALSVWTRGLIDSAVEVQFVFCRKRPLSHFSQRASTKGQLLPSAPQTWITKPDGLKLARCCEDALTGVCWTDDARVHAHHIMKAWADRDGLIVRIREAAVVYDVDDLINEIELRQMKLAALVAAEREAKHF